MKNMKIKILILTLVWSFVISSCSEDSLNKSNPNNLTTGSFYKTDSDLGKALTGVYAILQSVNLCGREWFFLHDLRSDDVSSGGGQLEAARNQILIGAHLPTNAVFNGVFNDLYRLIHRANAIIESAPDAETNDPNLKKRYVAEARFLRAWAYFQLVGFWGGVPLYETTGQSFSDAKARATEAEVFDFVVSELTALNGDLPTSYSGNDLGRVTKGAALMLLGKVYMFRGDFTSAKTQLEAVKGMGYSLVNEYFDNFTEEAEYNSESVWELSYTANGNFNWDGDGNDYGPNESWIRSQEYSAVGWRNLIPSDKLLAAYEVGDPRIKDTFYFIGDTYGDPSNPLVLTNTAVQGNTSVFQGVTQKVSWKKYSIMYKFDPGGYYDKIGMNYRIMRYADVLLMLAECENEVGSGANAIAYLNQVRARPSVNMPAYPTAAYPVNSKDEIFKAVMHERQVELGGEESRNFDILRWRKAGKFTTDPISYFEPNKYEFLPIPQDEINNNANIGPGDQNPGY